MVPLFAPTRVVYLSATSREIEPLRDALSRRFTEVGVTDYVLIQHLTRTEVVFPFGIHVAIRNYSPKQLITILDQNDALEDGEDLEYYESQGMDEDDIVETLVGSVFTLITDEVDADDLEASSPEEFDELLSTKTWTWTKIHRQGIYLNNKLTDAEIITELCRHP